MKAQKSIINKSLFFALLGALVAQSAEAAIRIGNQSRSYAEAYNQVNNQRAQAYQTQNQTVQNETVAASALPVAVENKEVEKQIQDTGTSSNGVGLSNLNSCAMIYPDGEFAWAKPTIGVGAGGASTCTAVVELRAYQMGQNGQDAVVARANLAAGDSFVCNISNFPEATYTPSAGTVTFPADKEPTTDDVVKVMNEEQKKNAGIKIAAGAILGGLGGNIAGKNELGNDSLFGTNKEKIESTAIGALSGAALLAGNSYAGKVGGDIILSTGVNAAAGGVIGNVISTGNSVLRIEKCKVGGVEKSCLWGTLQTGDQLPSDKVAFFNLTNRSDTYVCNSTDMTGCVLAQLSSIHLEAYPNQTIQTLQDKVLTEITDVYHLVKDQTGSHMEKGSGGYGSDGDVYAKISSATMVTQIVPAVVVGVQDKSFGFKNEDWNKWRTSHSDNASGVLYLRGANGEAYDLPEGRKYSLNDFYPMTLDAEDGSVIDLTNKARLQDTLVGAGAGGAMGAFAAYQGAQSDIQERWVSAVREYKDSLQKFYCATGTRFLGFYNDTVVIPNMSE